MAPKPGPGQITIADYLLTRLAQLGVKKIFGVPGDFTLGFLDYVEDHKDVGESFFVFLVIRLRTGQLFAACEGLRGGEGLGLVPEKAPPPG